MVNFLSKEVSLVRGVHILRLGPVFRVAALVLRLRRSADAFVTPFDLRRRIDQAVAAFPGRLVGLVKRILNDD